ncbi:hypothetical protein ACFVP3_29495 [Streptomyces sp. NPDC057806]|uniref:hypothetical protein n=1 Tax=Streptomyces sp. NPDC057806 TaxID=3346255 RepID=UPI0036979773
MSAKEIRACDEAVDDVEAAALGRARMADGRRVEMDVGNLAHLLDGGGGEAPRVGCRGSAEVA